MLDLAAARRRRTRWRFAAAAAAVVAIAGGLAGGLSAATSGTHTVYAAKFPGGASQWDSVQVTSKVTGASATIDYSDELWGNDFEVLVDHIPVGTTCQMWVVHPDGSRTQVAAWTVARDEGKVWYAGSMPSTSEPISHFQITAGNSVLLTATPT